MFKYAKIFNIQKKNGSVCLTNLATSDERKMSMKIVKKLLITLLLLFSMAIPCYADFQPDSDRWVWMGSTDTIGTWIDAKSMYEQPIYGDFRVYMWLLAYHNSPSVYIEKIQYNFDLRAKTWGCSDYIKYDMKGNVLSSSSFNDSERDSIIPGSRSENLYEVAKVYHNYYNPSNPIR